MPVEEMTVPSLTSSDLVDFIKKRDYVSFAEIVNRYGEAAKGVRAIVFPKLNILIWQSISDSLISALQESTSEIHADASQPLTYLMDGMVYDLPLAKRPPSNGYKKEHWLPIVLRPGSKCRQKNCLGPLHWSTDDA